MPSKRFSGEGKMRNQRWVTFYQIGENSKNKKQGNFVDDEDQRSPLGGRGAKQRGIS